MTTPLDDIDYGLTVRDPWAQAIIWGPKRIENRGKRPPDKIVGERIAIHCGKVVDEEATINATNASRLDEPWGLYDVAVNHDRTLSRAGDLFGHHHPGHIIGTVRVIGTVDARPDGLAHATQISGARNRRIASEVFTDGKVKHLTGIGHAVTDNPWWQGPVGWLLADPHPLDEPVAARGMPGIWDVDRQIEEAR